MSIFSGDTVVRPSCIRSQGVHHFGSVGHGVHVGEGLVVFEFVAGVGEPCAQDASYAQRHALIHESFRDLPCARGNSGFGLGLGVWKGEYRGYAHRLSL